MKRLGFAFLVVMVAGCDPMSVRTVQIHQMAYLRPPAIDIDTSKLPATWSIKQGSTTGWNDVTDDIGVIPPYGKRLRIVLVEEDDPTAGTIPANLK
jgi:hypothetical protein